MWNIRIHSTCIVAVVLGFAILVSQRSAAREDARAAEIVDSTVGPQRDTDAPSVQLGPRPYYLIEQMRAGPLKKRLEGCVEGPFRTSRFSIGHRGAPLQFPEHTRESYQAAARMGAGIIECDVTVTRDRELVCRHAQCDLHATTNILSTQLAGKCARPFQPATIDAETGELIRPASARCCTSDLTLAEFKSLQGKMAFANPRATTVEQYITGAEPFRTQLYATGGTLLSHAESIELFEALGVEMMPELKEPETGVPFGEDYTRQLYARQMIDEYRAAGAEASRVWPQSFHVEDVLYWIQHAPDFGRNAVLLEAVGPGRPTPTQAHFDDLRRQGIHTIAPPIPALLTDENGVLSASDYARRARAAGLQVLSWTTERSGRIAQDVLTGGDRFYYSTISSTLRNDGDIYRTIHALVEEAGIVGLFSDWPATTTYYANCFDLDGPVRRPR